MRTLSILIAAVLIAGCATSAFDRQQMPSKAPTAEFTTEKPIAAVAECVETGLRAVADAGHTVSATQDGEARIVWITTLANPNVAVRMAPAAGGTHVDYRSRYRAGYGKFTNAVLACR